MPIALLLFGTPMLVLFLYSCSPLRSQAKDIVCFLLILFVGIWVSYSSKIQPEYVYRKAEIKEVPGINVIGYYAQYEYENKIEILYLGPGYKKPVIKIDPGLHGGIYWGKIVTVYDDKEPST